MEMMVAPDSSSADAGGLMRSHVVPEPVYCAKLVKLVLAVSVIQMEEADSQTKPYGLKARQVEFEMTAVVA